MQWDWKEEKGLLKQRLYEEYGRANRSAKDVFDILVVNNYFGKKGRNSFTFHVALRRVTLRDTPLIFNITQCLLPTEAVCSSDT